MLEIDRLHVSYGPVTALRGVTLSVRKGSITAVVGPNGAGKSTCLKAVSGLAAAAQGEIRLDGQPIGELPANRRVHLGIAHVMEGRRLFNDQSVENNLQLGAFARLRSGASRSEIAQDIEVMYERFPILAKRRRQSVATLSGGEHQMLAIASALMSRPRVLLLDEPSLGLAPKIVDEVMTLISRLRDEGMTILLVEQMASLALSIADEGYVFERGQVVSSGKAADLLREMRLHAAYFGEATAPS